MLRTLNQWLRRSFRRTPILAHHRRPKTVLPGLELLEDRTVPIIGTTSIPGAVLPGGAYDGVVMLNSGGGTGSGSLIQPGDGHYILTVEHNNPDAAFGGTVAGSVTFNLQRNGVPVNVVVPVPANPGGGVATNLANVINDSSTPTDRNDISLWKLEDPTNPAPNNLLVGPFTAQQYALNRITPMVTDPSPLVGQNVNLVGYGLTGVGPVGEAGTFGVKRMGNNVIDSLGTVLGNQVELIQAPDAGGFQVGWMGTLAPAILTRASTQQQVFNALNGIAALTGNVSVQVAPGLQGMWWVMFKGTLASQAINPANLTVTNPITSISENAGLNTINVTTAAINNVQPNQTIVISGLAGGAAGYNGTFTVNRITNANTFVANRTNTGLGLMNLAAVAGGIVTPLAVAPVAGIAITGAAVQTTPAGVRSALAQTTAVPNLAVGQQVFISGVGAGYNGFVTVTRIINNPTSAVLPFGFAWSVPAFIASVGSLSGGGVALVGASAAPTTGPWVSVARTSGTIPMLASIGSDKYLVMDYDSGGPLNNTSALFYGSTQGVPPPVPAQQTINLSNAAAGTFAISNATEAGTTVTITTVVNHNFTNGQVVTLNGFTNNAAGYNAPNGVTIGNVTNNSFTFTAAAGLPANVANPPGATVSGSTFRLVYRPVTAPIAITNISQDATNNKVTVITAGANNFSANQQVVITGFQGAAAGYNNTFTITNILANNIFQFTDPISNLPISAGGRAYQPAATTQNAQFTAPIPSNASAADVLNALQALPGLAPSRPPSPGPFTINSASESGNLVTITTAAPHTLVSGQSVQITGLGNAAYNGTFTVFAVTATTFTYNDPNASGLPTIAGPGTARAAGAAIIGAIENGTTVTITTAGPNGLVTGQTATITGFAAAGYNSPAGGVAVTVQANNSFTYTAAAGLPAGPVLTNATVTFSGLAASAAEQGTTVTITTNAPHGFISGQTVVMSNFTGANAAYNGQFVITVPPNSNNTFTYTAVAGLGLASGVATSGTLTNPGAPTISVTGNAGGPWTVTYLNSNGTNNLSGVNVNPLMVANTNNVIGSTNLISTGAQTPAQVTIQTGATGANEAGIAHGDSGGPELAVMQNTQTIVGINESIFGSQVPPNFTPLPNNFANGSFGQTMVSVNVAAYNQPSSPITGAVDPAGIATITTVGASNYTVGEQVVISGVTVAGYDGTWTVTAVNPGANTLSYRIGGPAAILAGAGAGGTASGWIPGMLAATVPYNLVLDMSYQAVGQSQSVSPVAIQGHNVTVSLPMDPLTITAGSGGGRMVLQVNDPNNTTLTGSYFSGAANTIGGVTIRGASNNNTVVVNGDLGVESTLNGYAPSIPITSTVEAGVNVTVTTGVPHGFVVGQRVTLAGVDDNGYNATAIITGVPTPTTFTYVAAVGLLGPGNGGSATLTGTAIANATSAGTTITFTTSANHNFVAGQVVRITGMANAAYNGTFTLVTAAGNQFTLVNPRGPLPNSNGGSVTPVGASIASAAEAGNNVTMVTTVANSFVVGQWVSISGAAMNGYNGFFQVTQVTSPTTFVYNDTVAANLAPLGAGGQAFGVNRLVINAVPGSTYTVTEDTISRTGGSDINYANFQLVQINTTAGNNTVNIEGTDVNCPVLVNSTGGTTNVSVGSDTDELAPIAGAVFVVGAAPATTNLSVNDQGTGTAQNYTVTNSTVTRDGGVATISYRGVINNLTVTGGSGGNNVFIQSTNRTTTTTVNAGTGANNVTVGSATNFTGNLDNIWTVSLENTGNLTVNDQGTTGVAGLPLANRYTITDSSVTRADGVVINYDNNITSLTVEGPWNINNNVFNVESTNTNATLNTINIWNGTDTVNVGSTQGNDSVLGLIESPVLVDGAQTLNIRDQGSTPPQTYTVTATQVQRADGITVRYANITNLNLFRAAASAGNAVNTTNVQATAAGTTTSILGGKAADIVNVGSTTNSLANLQGNLLVTGAGPLRINDQGSPQGQNYTVTNTRVTAVGVPGTITYTQVGRLIVNMAPASTTNVQGTNRTTSTIIVGGTAGANRVNVGLDLDDLQGNLFVFRRLLGGTVTLSVNDALGQFGSVYNNDKITIPGVNWTLGRLTVTRPGNTPQIGTIRYFVDQMWLGMPAPPPPLNLPAGTAIVRADTAPTTINTGGPGAFVQFSLPNTVPSALAYPINVDDSPGLATVQFQLGDVNSTQVSFLPLTDLSATGGSFEVATPVQANNAYVSAGDMTVDALLSLTLSGKVGLSGGTLDIADGYVSDTGDFSQGSLNTLSIALDNGMPTPITTKGVVSLSGLLDLNADPTFNPSPGSTITLISNQGQYSVNGTFAGLPEGAPVVVNNISFVISYQGGLSQRDVVLTCVAGPPSSSVPVANYFTVPAGEGQTTSINALTHANGGNGNPLTIFAFSQPAQGNLVYNATTGLFAYTPFSNTYTGPDSFTYQVTDGTNVSNVAIVAIMVNPINHAPQGTNNTVSTTYLTPYPFAEADFGFSDPNDTPANQFLAVEITTLPSVGTLTDAGSAVTAGQFVSVSDILAGDLAYTPAVGGTGTDSFTFQVQDDGGTAPGGSDTDPNPKTMTITVAQATPIVSLSDDGGPYNGLPYPAMATIAGVVPGVDDTPSSSLEGVPLILTYYAGSSAAGTPLAGAPSQVGTYTVVASFAGSTDYVSANMQGTFTITDVPTAVDDSYTMLHDQTLTTYANQSQYGLLSNDADAGAAALTITQVNGNPVALGTPIATTDGSLTLNADGSFTYTPNAGFVGQDSFTYTISDGVATAAATATITVTNTPPVANDDSYAVLHDQTLTTYVNQYQYGLLNNDYDSDGDALTITQINGNPITFGMPIVTTDGSLTLNADGSFSYTPDAGFVGQDWFTYTITDGAATATATATINVTNQAPAANNDSYTVLHDQTLTTYVNQYQYGLLNNDYDLDGDAPTITQVNGSPVTFGTPIATTDGSLTLNADGSFLYTPLAGFTGSDSFTYTISDGIAASAATVTINVTNTPPVANDDSYAVLHDQTLTTYVNQYQYGLLNNDYDPDGDALSITQVNGMTVTFGSPMATTDGTLTLNADGSFTYSPLAGFVGADSFTYTISDGIATATATATINVTNTPPMANDDYYTVLHDQTLTTYVNQPQYGVLSNDYDPDGDVLSITQVNGATVTFGSPMATTDGTLTLNADGSFTYIPTAGFVGTDSFTYTITDGIATATATATINVTNAAPVANNDYYTVLHDQILTTYVNQPQYGVLSNDYDPDGDALSISQINGMIVTFGSPMATTDGILTLNADGSFTYTPAAGFTGTDSFTYTITDGIATATATATINVYDNPPVANNDYYTVLHDHTLTTYVNQPQYGVLSNDSDPDGDPLTITQVNGAPVTFGSPIATTDGTLTLNADGSFLYTPSAGFTGSDSFIYTISDGIATATATATINVYDNPPVANNDYYTVLHDQTLTTYVNQPQYGVLSNDSDPDGDPLTITQVNGMTVTFGSPMATTHGTLTLHADGSFSYTPQAGFVGTDSFTYTISDGIATATATATINVTNTPPVANNDYYTVLHDHTLTTYVNQPQYGVLSNDSDPDGDPLSITKVNGVTVTFGSPVATTHGTLTLHADGSFIYTPSAGFTGSDSFTYTISDGIATATATATINVTNIPPVANYDWYTMLHDHTLTTYTNQPQYGVLSNDYDSDGDALTITQVNGMTVTFGSPMATTHGTLTLHADGSFIYTPSTGFTGSDSFTYTISDGIATATASVTINVTNTPPVANYDYYTVLHNHTLTTYVNQPQYGVLSNDSDPDGDPLSITRVNGVTVTFGSPMATTHGTLTLNANGSFTYTPTAGFVGMDSFTYTISDGIATATATATINVTNTLPVANNDWYTVAAGQTLTTYTNQPQYGVLANDSDPDGDTLAITQVNGHAVSFGTPTATMDGMLTLNANGSFLYTPMAGFAGMDSFTYTITDGIATAMATATINVTNQAPMAMNDYYTVLHDHMLTTYVNQPQYGVLFNDSDPNGNRLTITRVNGATVTFGSPMATMDGTLTLHADGSFTYTPAAGFAGADSFTYTISDGIATATATVTINVTNQAPMAMNDYYTVVHDRALMTYTNQPQYGVLSNDSDMDGDALTIIRVNGAPVTFGSPIATTDGTLTLHADGSFTYTPTAGFVGTDSFTYTISDGIASATATVTISVTNQPPMAMNDSYSVASGQTLTTYVNQPQYGLLNNDYDPDGDTLTITQVNGSAVTFGSPIVISHGTLTLSADGSFTYTPATGYSGTDSFTYTISDGATRTIATATINVASNTMETITGFTFSVWLSPGDTLTSVDYQFTSSPFGGMVYASGTAMTTLSNYQSNSWGYDEYTVTVSGLNIMLPSGTSWISLQNAVTASGGLAYWGEDDGASQAYENTLGAVGSEAFTITGTSGTLYNNGPDPGTINAWTINYGYAVTNSFTLP